MEVRTKEQQSTINVGKYYKLRNTSENRYSVDFQHSDDVIFTSNIVLEDKEEIDEFISKLNESISEKEKELDFYLNNGDQKTLLKTLDDISDSTVMKMRMSSDKFDENFVNEHSKNGLNLSENIEEKKEIKTTDLGIKTKGSLSNVERMEIENVFKGAKDFREVGEKITAPIDSIIDETSKIIDKDPIMTVNDELVKMNGSVQSVYKEIIDNDSKLTKGLKSIPLIGGLVKILDEKRDQISFNLKSTTGKIESIFSGFDTSYNSLNTSIEMQKKFSEGIENNLNKVVLYHEFISEKLEEFRGRALTAETQEEKDKYNMFISQVEYFKNNLTTLIGNLQLTQKRINMRLDSSHKLSLAMSSSRPIFKTLLSTAIIESSSQKAIEASLNTISIMGQTIDNMSKELTDKAIESNRKTEELTSKSVLSTTVFIENVTKLKNHFDSIEQFRQRIKIEADKEKALFKEAQDKLKEIKTLKSGQHEEFKKEIGVG